MQEKFEPIPYKMTVNMKSTMPVKSHLEATVGDTKAYYLEFTIYNGRKLYNLIGVTDITITFKKADGNTAIGFVNILDAENGRIGYLMGSQEITCAGKLIATIELYGADGERITSPEIEFNVKDQLDDGNAITSTTEYGVLTTLMTEEGIRVNQENQRVENEEYRKSVFNNRIETLDGKTQEFDSKLIEINNHTIVKKDELDLHTTEKITEVDEYINNTSKPSIDSYVETTTKPSIDNYWMENPSRYVWIESKTINKGLSSLTLENIVGAGNKLLIFDNTYGCKWIEGIHWTRSNQIITFTSDMPENITFEIINLG